MNQKTSINLFLYVFLTLFMLSTTLSYNPCFAAEDTTNENIQSIENKTENDEENEFNFIKSSNYNNFFDSDDWLLYGGIILIIISITGTAFTLRHKKPRNIRNTKKLSIRR